MKKTQIPGDVDLAHLFPAVEFALRHQHVFPYSTLRGLIQRAESNGLCAFDAIYKVGKRNLIHEPNFLAWVKTHKLSRDAMKQLAPVYVAAIDLTDKSGEASK